MDFDPWQLEPRLGTQRGELLAGLAVLLAQPLRIRELAPHVKL